MSSILLVAASPHVGGVTDALSAHLADALMATVITLRDHKIRPCTGCDHCRTPPHLCPLSQDDDADWILETIISADLVLFCAPIYFYSLPAQTKALIDRAQRFWQRAQKSDGAQAIRPAMVLLSAGRSRGASLFTGALLTLGYFFSSLGRKIVEHREFRGTDHKKDFLQRTEVRSELTDIVLRAAQHTPSRHDKEDVFC